MDAELKLIFHKLKGLSPVVQARESSVDIGETFALLQPQRHVNAK